MNRILDKTFFNRMITSLENDIDNYIYNYYAISINEQKAIELQLKNYTN